MNRTWERTGLLAAAAGISAVAGWSLVQGPRYALAPIGVCAVLLIIARPRAAVIGFALAAFAAEWFFQASRQGMLAIPSPLTSVSSWALIAWLAASVLCWPHLSRLGEGLHPLVARAVAVYTTGVLLEVIMAVGLGVPGAGWNGAKAIAIASSPIPLMALLHRIGSRTATGIVVGAFATEAVFALIQRGKLQFGSAGSYLTVGDAARVWDSRAVFGTFASVGNHEFANVMVIGIPVVLTVALTSADRRARLGAWLLCILMTADVVLSLARIGIVVLAAVFAVFVLSRGSGRMLATITAAVALAIIVPSTRTALGHLQNRGVVDQSTSARLTIWNTLIDRPSSSWLLGHGYGQAPEVTAAAGIDMQHWGTGPGPTTDNLYLREVIEGGVLGLTALLGFLIMLMRASFLAPGPWAVALRAVAVALALQSVTSDTIFFPQQMAALALVLGVIGIRLVSQGTRSEERPLES